MVNFPVMELRYHFDFARVVSAKKKNDEIVKIERIRKDNSFIKRKLKDYEFSVKDYI